MGPFVFVGTKDYATGLMDAGSLGVAVVSADLSALANSSDVSSWYALKTSIPSVSAFANSSDVSSWYALKTDAASIDTSALANSSDVSSWYALKTSIPSVSAFANSSDVSSWYALKTDAAKKSQIFAGYPSTHATSATGDTTFYQFSSLTANRNDNSNMNLTTGIWTAPADGYLRITGTWVFGNINSGHTQGYAFVSDTSLSNPIYSLFGNFANMSDSSQNIAVAQGGGFIVASGDTYMAKARVSNGTKTVTVWGGIGQTYLAYEFTPD